ncbi:probable RNA-binding protein 18 isoform X1 [Cucurbita moschata]|uniref:Probable RNA-binding protein 18 n=1 Tax=Cucurbita moschata TaxID=3662 RepID=A0A6J1H211_CUCMO|nr:probable RNA-binding protein 18 isoform X1 [Cucurbita moschata]XP_022958045.1 probable RNA-binding protein 18 isoform X1 [Cucurbita moschata]XP_022958048.1 probable RNA-binding protein 18 isoform X1 [Cucurbita moschata]
MVMILCPLSLVVCHIGIQPNALALFYTTAIDIVDSSGFVDEKCESKLYIGNLDLRITEAALIKMFSPFGKIISEDFLWHTRGPKRGEPRGFAFIEYSSKEEAKLAKESMHGKLACSRPLVVRLASEKLVINTTNNNNTSRAAGETSKSRPSGSNYGHMSRSDKIAAIKNKLRALEGGEGERSGVKKQKQGQVSCRNNIDK